MNFNRLAADVQRITNMRKSEELLQTFKSEAFDDSPIDNNRLAELELAYPGLFGGSIDNFEMTASMGQIHHNMVLEALDTNTLMKGGLIAATLLLLFKIIKLITGNKEYSSGSGRGSPSGVKARTEEITTAVTELERVVETAAPAAEQIARNPAIMRQPVVEAALDQLIIVERGEGPIEQLTDSDRKDILREIGNTKNLMKSMADQAFKMLPAYCLAKDDKTALIFTKVAIELLQVVNENVKDVADAVIEYVDSAKSGDSQPSMARHKNMIDGVFSKIYSILKSLPAEMIPTPKTSSSRYLNSDILNAQEILKVYSKVISVPPKDATAVEGIQLLDRKKLADEIGDLEGSYHNLAERFQYMAEVNKAYLEATNLIDSVRSSRMDNLAVAMQSIQEKRNKAWSGETSAGGMNEIHANYYNYTQVITNVFINDAIGSINHFRISTNAVDKFQDTYFKHIEKLTRNIRRLGEVPLDEV